MRDFSRLSAALIASFGLFLSAPLAAAESEAPVDMRVTYDFYLGGLPLATAKIQLTTDGDRYEAISALKTVGLVGYFFDTEFVSSVDGRHVPGEALTPQHFQMRWRTKDKGQEVTVDYDDTAPSAVSAEPPFKKKWYEIDPTEQSGSIDPITAIATTLLLGDVAEICNRTLPVFDSRKRFDIIFSGVSREYDRKGVPMVECKGEYRRIAGFKKKMMKKPSYPFTIRFAIQPDGTPKAVRIWGETAFGAAVALLRDD